MSFKVALTETYAAPVSVLLPGDKSPYKFEIIFHRKTQDEVELLSSQARTKTITDKQFCREIVAGWGGKQVLDEDGTPIEYSTMALEELLCIYPVPASIVESFYASISGARLKN